jgi:RHS repeat-associated protein
MNRLTKITAPDQTYTQFAYDYRGRRISVTDANGKTTAYQYDDADRLVAVTDAAQNVTIYGYDTENNMVDITDAASHQTSFAYDALGRVTAVTFPSTLSESYTYDAMNNLLSNTDRKQQMIIYGYDALYRLTSKTYPDQTAVNYTYDPLSRLTQVTDPTGTYSFTYDNLGRLTGTGTQYSFFSSALNNSYVYDAASNRTSFTDPAGATSTSSYDSLNRLTGLANTNSGNFGFGYDALGRRTSLTRPNGVNTSYSYDTLSRLLSVLHAGGALPGSTGYTYDAAGNRLTKTAVQQATPNPVSVTSNYSYDAIYELTQAVVGGTMAESYSYNAVGNRLTSAGPTTYSYNTSNELTSTSAATYTYDNNGNTTSKTDSTGTTYYTWDFENRLASVTLPGTGGTVNFKYDPFGRRIEKIAPMSGTTIYAYDGDNITEELGAGGNLLAHYTQGAGSDEPLAMTGTGGIYFYHADGLGSTTSLTDSTGNVAASYVYDSFGKLTASTGSVPNPFQYTGREFDSEMGLQYHRARYYDPVNGRFLSEDPAGFAGGMNMYGYAADNPVNLLDPDGLAAKTCRTLAQLAGVNQDAGLLARLIYIESTGVDLFMRNYSQVENPAMSASDAFLAEREAIAESVYGRISYVKNNPNVPGTSQNGPTMAGVIGAVGQFRGFYDPKGNVRISAGNRKRITEALNSPCDSLNCIALLISIGVAKEFVSGHGHSPFGGKAAGFRTSGTGSPGPNFYQLDSIPGSGNTFFGIR